MRWLASINLLLFLSGLVKAGDWEDTGKGGRWLVRRNRAAEEEELSRRKRDAELDEDEEDVSHEEEGLLDFLAPSSKENSEGEVVPKEKVSLKFVKVFLTK